jgi:hypothetical protein
VLYAKVNLFNSEDEIEIADNPYISKGTHLDTIKFNATSTAGETPRLPKIVFNDL